MKTTLLITSILLGTSAFAVEADSTGLEGDHLDLEAVMEIFKDSDSPEDFEKKLNTESNNVNNLDLDGDGQVDYIRVVDAGDSTSHVLTLQVPVTETESQDIATIELEETDKDVVEIQIVGDEELYGENYVMLPESAGRGPVVINVIMWRPVRFMWAPRYAPWVSPWRYRAYPNWYRPWNRRSWGHYRRGVVVYRGGCRRVYRRSFTHAHVHHYHRTHSASFHHTHHHKHTGKTAAKSGKTGAKASNSKSATTPNTKKVTATHRQKTQSATPTQKAASQEKSQSRSTKTNARKRPGTQGTNGSKRTRTSTTGNKSRKSGNSGRSSGGGKRKN